MNFNFFNIFVIISLSYLIFSDLSKRKWIKNILSKQRELEIIYENNLKNICERYDNIIGKLDVEIKNLLDSVDTSNNTMSELQSSEHATKKDKDIFYLLQNEDFPTVLNIIRQDENELDKQSWQRFTRKVVNKMVSREYWLLTILRELKGNGVTIENDETLLLFAIEQDLSTVALYLMEMGANVNYEINYAIEQNEDNYETPLTLAIALNNITLVNNLCFHGANVNQELDKGLGYFQKPIEIAIKEGHIEIVEILLSKGANFTITDYNKMSKSSMNKLDDCANEEIKNIILKYDNAM